MKGPESKPKYPAGFYYNSPPTFYDFKPINTKNKITEINKETLYDGQPLNLDLNYKYKIVYEHDYDGCYYPGEPPSIKCELVAYTEEEVPNADYEKELVKYNNKKLKHTQDLKVWKKWKVIWDQDQKDIKEKRERTQLANLKKKYESNN